MAKTYTNMKNDIINFLNKIFSHGDDMDINTEEVQEKNEEKAKEKPRTRPWAWVVIIIFAVIIGIYLSSQSQTTAVYLVQCNDWFKVKPVTLDFSNCQEPKAMNRQVFTVDVSKNQVIQTSPDTADVIKLNSCTIQDNQHWGCGTINSMSGGMLAATLTSRSGDNFAEYGPTNIIMVTEEQWNSINNGKSSQCGLGWCN